MDLLDRLRLDVPVAQAGMGGGLAGPELAVAVAAAGGLGTLGLAPATDLREAIRQVRGGATGRAVAVNLLMPFVRRGHVEECVNSRVDVVVTAFGIDRDVKRAGTRFLLTHESRAHPEYQRRILAADKTIRTTLFGMGWPAPHRVVANAATRRWCHDDGHARLLPRIVNAGSGFLPKLPDRAAASVIRLQAPALPLFSPIAPTGGMSDSVVDRAALYAGETVLRITSVISARQAVVDLAPGGQ